MTTHDTGDLVRRMQECFNSRQFDQADDLFTPDFFSHPTGATGIEAGKDVWRTVVAHFPDYRVVAEDVVVGENRVVIRSSVEGVPGDVLPMLIEIFRVENGRLAEMWGVAQGLPDDVVSAAARS